VLQCVAVCCSVLQCVAVCRSVLNGSQCVALCCRVLQCVAVRCRVEPSKSSTDNYCHISYVVGCCSVLQCVAGCCSVMQCDAVCCSVLQIVAESVLHVRPPSHCHTLQHTATHRNTRRPPSGHLLDMYVASCCSVL